MSRDVHSLSGDAPWLLVFDLDGTLVDSSLDLCLAVNAALQHVGAGVLPHPLISSFIGNGAAALVRRSLEVSGRFGQADGEAEFARVANEALSFFLQYYSMHKLDHTCLYEGVFPALETIRRRLPQLPMAVLTNKPVRPAREICDGLRISQFFFDIVGGDTFRSKKPDPEGLLALMGSVLPTLHGQACIPNPAGIVLVGDSETDVETARNAGARIIGCTYGLAPDRLRLAGPDVLCDSAHQWPNILCREP